MHFFLGKPRKPWEHAWFFWENHGKWSVFFVGKWTSNGYVRCLFRFAGYGLAPKHGGNGKISETQIGQMSSCKLGCSSIFFSGTFSTGNTMKHWIVPMIRDFSTVDLPLQSTRNMWAIDKVPSCYTDYSVECPRHPYAHSHMAVTSGDSRCTVPRGWNSWDGAWLSRWSVLPIIMANLRHMFLLVSTYRCVYVYVYI